MYYLFTQVPTQVQKGNNISNTTLEKNSFILGKPPSSLPPTLRMICNHFFNYEKAVKNQLYCNSIETCFDQRNTIFRSEVYTLLVLFT